MWRRYKDPDSTVDFEAKWQEWLRNDAIATSQWVLPEDPDNLTVVETSNTATTATIWISGGVDKRTYYLVNRISTVGGRANDQTLVLTIQER